MVAVVISASTATLAHPNAKADKAMSHCCNRIDIDAQFKHARHCPDKGNACMGIECWLLGWFVFVVSIVH